MHGCPVTSMADDHKADMLCIFSLLQNTPLVIGHLRRAYGNPSVEPVTSDGPKATVSGSPPEGASTNYQ